MPEPPARPPAARPPMSSITREVAAPELTPLVDATRPVEELDTAALGGAEMDALLATERASAPAPKPKKPPKEAPPSEGTVVLRDVRPRPPAISVMPAEPTVVLAPSVSAMLPAEAGLSASAPSSASSSLLQSASGGGGAMGPPSFAAAASAPVNPSSNPTPPASPDSSASLEATFVAGSYASARVAPGARGRARPAAAAPPIGLLAIGAGALVLVVVTIVVLAIRARDQASEDARAATASALVAAGTGAPTGAPGDPQGKGALATAKVPASGGGAPTVGTSSPASANAAGNAAGEASPAPAGTPEAEARAALSRLRDGIGTCVRDVIGVLPGTTPPIPAAITQLRGGAYKSVPRDFRSPVFACAKFKLTEPQRFQIQWQLVQRPSEGRGVVWLDDDGDGTPDRAFAFRAALVGKRDVDLGEIGALVPVPAVMKALQ